MRTIGLQQLMSASLYREDAQLDSFTKALIREHVEQRGLVVASEPRVAYHFGQLVHAPQCDPSDPSTECPDDCAIVDCDEDAATIVMMRVEVDVDA